MIRLTCILSSILTVAMLTVAATSDAREVAPTTKMQTTPTNKPAKMQTVPTKPTAAKKGKNVNVCRKCIDSQTYDEYEWRGPKGETGAND